MGFLIGLWEVKPVQRAIDFIRDEADSPEPRVDPRRTAYVRIQKPKPLLIELRIGGTIHAVGWADVTVERYDTNPKDALAEAVDDYDGYRISHYVEQHPDAAIDEPLAQIDDDAWVEVDPERDLPDD